MEARGYFGVALYCKLGTTHIFVNSPFDRMSYEQGRLSNLLMECLEDVISTNKTLLEQHRFFKLYDQVQVLFFPVSLVKGDENFKHLRHLNPIQKYWCSDYGLMNEYTYGIRFIFNDNILTEAFMETKDRSLQIDLLVEILNQLNEIAPDREMVFIKEQLELQKPAKPRFKMFQARKKASFPEFINSFQPTLYHFKMGKKKMAELAKVCNLSEGYYTLQDAKIKLNALRDAAINEINSEIRKYDFKKSIPYLLTRIDALNDWQERMDLTIKHSVVHDVDYSREEEYSKQHVDYIKMHRDYRYLIEKFVQLQPEGHSIEEEQFQYLIAFIDWLHVFYVASDSLHYGIHPVGMKIGRDSLVEVVYDESLIKKEKEFAEEEAKLKLGLIGNPDDRVSSPRSLDDFLEALDRAFRQDLKFTFRSMINVLQVLTRWSDFRPHTETSPFYSGNLDEIKGTCLENIEGISLEEIGPIINFLTLKSEDIIRLSGQDETCSDLPVWEHRKRYARYNLKPIIVIDGVFYWGPYSVRRSGIIWSGNLSYGTLPTDLQSPAIQEILRSEKKLIEDNLVIKTLEIVKRVTPYARSNVWLHKLDKAKNFPSDLGDYDVLVFYPEKNIVLNIECKDILPPFCQKDAKTLRETIFGEGDKDQGHFKQINKRRVYLSDNFLEIAKTLNWPIELSKLPEIVTLYVTRMTYWWTKFPPYEIDAVFQRVDLLSKFIEGL